MVVALFAALIVPQFIHWNDYRASFAAEASRILGHRVHVEGDARATILPSPSLTFTDVEVDDQNGNNLMTVGRFDVVIELMPLLQGKIQVVSMVLEKPVVNVTVDGAGKIAWLSRAKLREPFDPDKVVLDNITIKDGTLKYADQQTGVQLAFDRISAQVSARALTGPWHVDGSYLDHGRRVSFGLSTGRVLADGGIRVQANVIPAGLPVTVAADGPLGIDAGGGLSWHGTYSVNQVVADAGADGSSGNANDGGTGSGGNAADGPSGWRSEGAFALTADQLDISKAVLSNGPVDKAFSLAGTLKLDFGRSPSFAATAEANQIDLDRTLGAGPSQPVDVAAAADSLVAWLSRLPVPDIPGSISLSVPTIVVGGRIIENVAFTAAPAKGGWQVQSLSAALPGQATVTASGLLSTRKKFGFDGQAHLVVRQPATFATWWRGGNQQGAGRLLAPFDLSGHAEIGPGRLAFDHATARIDNATITGHFDWGEGAKDHRRSLGAVLDAKGRIDFTQLKALAELLVGHNLTNASLLADDYRLQVSADALAFSDLTIKGIKVNAVYGNDTLTVTTLQIDDLAGAKIEGMNGKIENLSGDPRGHLVTTFDAPQVTGLARLADRLLPKSGFTRWLDVAAPALGEAAVKNVAITAPLPDGSSGFVLSVDKSGVAGSTAIDKLSAAFTGGFAHWRTKPADITATLSALDSAQFVRQLGLAAVPLPEDSGAKIDINAKGVPADGLNTVVEITSLAGLHLTARGKLTIGNDLAPSFVGTLDADSDDINPVATMAGITMPGTAASTPLWFDKASLKISGKGLDLGLKNAKVGPAIVSGAVSLAPESAGGWHVGGSLVADTINLGWIAALGLGEAPLPTGDPAKPWSHVPFTAPGYGMVNGELQVKADRLDVGGLGLTGTAFKVTLHPQRIDVDLTAGQLAGGTVIGHMRIHNVDGNANFAAGFDLKGAALESFVWRRDGRSVATGTLDLSASFQATGRSPAGLVSTMTGGGALAVNDGVARYVNPDTERQIVRASDLGQQFSEDALRAAFAERIDADNLAFKQASGAFAIVAGAVRLKNLMVQTKGLAAKGNAVIDFNTMTIDSDWNLAFDPVDNKVPGAEPTAGIVFRGPIAAPARSIDVLPFAAYLNEREAARMTEILALSEASRVEKERLNRLVDKLKADDLQRKEDQRIAAAREAARRAAAAAQAAKLEAFHANREIAAEKRHVEALTAFADSLAAQQAQAEAAAGAAAQAATAAQAKAKDAAAALASARKAESDAANKADAAAAALAKAGTAAETARQEAAQLADAEARAQQALGRATQAEAAARTDADTAAQAKAAAEAALKSATAKAAAAADTATRAAAAAKSAASEKTAAETAAAAALKARDAAKAELAKAEAAVTDAQKVADMAANQATTLGGGEAAAQAAKAKADAEAQAAGAALTAATAARDDAAAKLEAAKSDAAAAQKAADSAASVAKQAAELAKAMAAGDGADAQAIATAQAMQTAADGAAQQAATKKAAADSAAQALTDARAAFDTAQQTAADAQKRSDAAATAVANADAAVKDAAANANRAATDKATAQADLEKAITARDAARTVLAEKETAVEKTAGALKTASAAALDAANAAATATRRMPRPHVPPRRMPKRRWRNGRARPAMRQRPLKRRPRSGWPRPMPPRRRPRRRPMRPAHRRTAARTLADRTRANDRSLSAAAKSASTKRQTAEAAAEDASARAETAQAAAQSAKAQALDATAAAQAARQSAEQAAQNAVGGGPIEIPVPAAPNSSSASAPGGITAAADPIVTKSVPVPRRTNAPLTILPGAIPRNGELAITPPKY